jgi:succinate dehydrogenase / fumarate reductase, membrane anchor subunit
MSLETPLHRVRGLGSAHSGVDHFAYQRVSALVLVPLTVWFAITAIGLAGVGEVAVLGFLANPMHAILMGIFILTVAVHFAIGLQEVIIDYVPHGGVKLLLILIDYSFAVVVALFCFFCLLRIAL